MSKKEQLKDFSLQIPLSKLRKITSKFDEKPEDMPITFEFLMVSLFPTVWNNVQKYANDCFMQGYLQGKEDAKNES